MVDRWAEAVGAAIARNAWPSRVGRDGTLHVATADSTWAFELTHRSLDIASRLGVPKVRFAPGPLPEEGAQIAPPEPARPSAEHERAAAEIAAAITDENLRKSVQKAVSLSLARPTSDRPV